MSEEYQCPTTYTSKLLLFHAIRHYGVAEIPGADHSPLIMQWTRQLFSWASDDDTIPWCSIFMEAMANECGLEHPGSATARDWLDVGISVANPVPGDVAVFWRGSPQSWKGHVGIYINERNDQINVLGGNQGDRVQISPYPYVRLLSYRRLRKVQS